MKLILLGPPGSGKGTVSERLAKEFRLRHISPGEILREEVRKKTRLGKEIEKYLSRGDLVPDKLVEEIVKLEIKGKKNYILDGFPRSLGQAKAIENWKINRVIYLDVPEKAVIKRLAGRRICQKGEHSYHLQYFPPKKRGVCDDDGTPLIRRKDDAPRAIKERFRIFHRETEPVVKYYQKKGLLRKVDGNRGPKEVYLEVYLKVKKVLRNTR